MTFSDHFSTSFLKTWSLSSVLQIQIKYFHYSYRMLFGSLLISAESRSDGEVTNREIGHRISRLTSSCMFELIFGPQWRDLISKEEHRFIIESNYSRPKNMISVDFLMQNAYKCVAIYQLYFNQDFLMSLINFCKICI